MSVRALQLFATLFTAGKRASVLVAGALLLAATFFGVQALVFGHSIALRRGAEPRNSTWIVHGATDAETKKAA